MTEFKEAQKVQIVKPEKLTGRVAQLISARELAINIGLSQGVKQGMRFAVMSEFPMEVVDPESGEVLDKIDREKVRVEAVEVRERITICRTFRIKKVGGGGLISSSILMGAMDPFAEPREVVETLRTKDASLPAPLTPEESYVKIKDRVVLIEDVN